MNEVAVKQSDREMWASGDYDAIADHIWDVGERIVERLAVRAPDEVLDVACGTGNAAIRAAQQGASVTGLDLTPELFGPARSRAARIGVEVRWVEGDAESLPFEDERFDVVISTFGCMFAPRHDVAARELGRVLRPGGRLGLCNWTPEGFVGDFFRTLAAHVPSPAGEGPPAVAWGTEEHVRRLFEGSGIELTFERDVTHLRYASVEDGVKAYETQFGPVVKTRELLEPSGAWAAARADFAAMLRRHNAVSDGRLDIAAEYLVVIGARQG